MKRKTVRLTLISTSSRLCRRLQYGPEKLSWIWAPGRVFTFRTENVYPVEQFPNCDHLAGEMGILPALGKVRSLRTWLKIMFTPASTTHYVDQYFDRQSIDRERVYTPAFLLAFLTLMRLLGLPIRIIKSARSKKP